MSGTGLCRGPFRAHLRGRGHQPCIPHEGLDAQAIVRGNGPHRRPLVLPLEGVRNVPTVEHQGVPEDFFVRAVDDPSAIQQGSSTQLE